MGIDVAYLPPNAPNARGAVAIGFAIPAPTVVDVVEQLLDVLVVAERQQAEREFPDLTVREADSCWSSCFETESEKR